MQPSMVESAEAWLDAVPGQMEDTVAYHQHNNEHLGSEFRLFRTDDWGTGLWINNNGPKQEPWRKPETRSDFLESVPRMETCQVMLDK